MFSSAGDGGVPFSFISGGGGTFDDGLVIFNSTDPMNPSWTNITNKDLPYFSEYPNTEYVRYGDQGILLVIGGLAQPGDPNGPHRPTNSIPIYDIASGKWFTQATTGDAPPSSQAYCSAVSAAPDDSSMHLILYGGWDVDDAATVAGVYILVMPAFRWIKINTNYANGVIASERRVNQHCTTYKDRQLLVFGGIPRSGGSLNCTSDFSPLRMLDLSTYQWQANWPLRNTTYEVPKVITDIVGGGPAGGAKAASTWQSALGANVPLFSKTVPRYDIKHPVIRNANLTAVSSTSSTAATTQTNSASSTLPSASRSSSGGGGLSGGAVAGIVLGSVAGAIGIPTALLFLIFCRRRSSSAHPRGASSQTSPGSAGSPYDKPELMNPENSQRGPFWWTKMHEMPAQRTPMTGRELDGSGVREKVEVPGYEAPELGSGMGGRYELSN